MPQTDREKLSEREIAELPKGDVEKIERVCKAFEDMAEAEAKHESQKKMRILFERAPAETLPFIVYVIYMGAVAKLAFSNCSSKRELSLGLERCC